MNLLIVIINYRCGDLTIDCLASLAPEIARVPGTSVVVTDNASADGSAERIADIIETRGWTWARLMPLPRNGGFAYGNNEGIKPAMASVEPPRYVMLLNPDTLVRSGAISALYEFMESHPQCGMAGSRLEDPDGTPQRSAFRFPTICGEINDGLRWGLVSRLLRKWVVAPPVVDQACLTDWVAAASMIIRRQVLEQVGLLDEAFFMYFEETDFCRRARRQGWPCWYIPSSRVVHLVGQASGVTDPNKTHVRRPGYWFDSRRRYFLKNHGWFYSVLTDALWVICFSVWRARRLIQRKPDRDPPHFLGDFLRHSTLAGRIS